MAETKTIRSIAYDQHEILYNIMQLYTDGQPFECDPTYSIGNFYGDFTVTTIEGNKMDISIPQPKYKFDVAPQVEGVVQIDPWGPIPLEDNSVSSVCIDLPFVISCGPSMQGPNFDENGKRVKNNMISRRFASYYPVAELLKSYRHWIEEAYRILKPNGILAFKCQKTITGSKALNTPEYSWLIAESLGFDMVDSFMLLAKARLISGKVKKQQHSRRFESEFLVFKKALNKKIRYLHFTDVEDAKAIMDGFLSNNISKNKKKNRVQP